MALNERLFAGTHIPLTVTAGMLSGAPVVVGTAAGCFVGVLETNADPVTNVATVDIHGGVYNLSVKGVTNGAVNSAVAQGDLIYYNATHTPVLDKDTTGILFGVAWEAVASGATTIIGVKVKTV